MYILGLNLPNTDTLQEGWEGQGQNSLVTYFNGSRQQTLFCTEIKNKISTKDLCSKSWKYNKVKKYCGMCM